MELTDNDLLEAGVSLMAQPPGKRNSSVQLLSGGEKAMTAVALIFSIFQLNPSPVCLLDEVDAPLDDINVTRFTSLIKEMSATVQFLVITHNKITMEMADFLMGVTMQEPGVSRLVSVDVEAAAELAIL